MMNLDLTNPVASGNSIPCSSSNSISDIIGPLQVDQMIRTTLQFCWMSLPKKDTAELRKQFSRLVDRALNEFEDDRHAFGLDSIPDDSSRI
jgi:hypothetical protein